MPGGRRLSQWVNVAGYRRPWEIAPNADTLERSTAAPLRVPIRTQIPCSGATRQGMLAISWPSRRAGLRVWHHSWSVTFCDRWRGEAAGSPAGPGTPQNRSRSPPWS